MVVAVLASLLGPAELGLYCWILQVGSWAEGSGCLCCQPATLDSSSCTFSCLWTIALTFLPTHFCFLKDCVQELFCCFHFILPIKVFLKAGWAAAPPPDSLAFSFGRIIFPNFITQGKEGGGGAGDSSWFPIYRECGSDFFSFRRWPVSDWWSELQSELGWGSSPVE